MHNFQLGFEAIGTHWLIDIYNSPISRKDLYLLIKNRIDEFDITYSRFRSDSLVWKMSKKTGEYILPKDGKKIMDYYEKLYVITNGSFSLLVGNVLDQAGYDKNYSLIPRKISKVPSKSSVFTYKFPKLVIKKPFILDFGALGKGYLIDILSKLFIEYKIETFCIDAGGDILYKNKENIPLRVGLENPNNLKQVIGVVEINNQSICASAGNKRKWNKYHHIINPKTLASPNNILATWVLADDAITADAMATCLFLEKPEKLNKYYKFEYLILYPDYSVKKSANFNSELFLKSNS